MKNEIETVYELTRSAALARFRICRVEGEEHPDRSWQRVTCHLHRQDVSWSAIPRIYRIGALSFADARPGGSSENDYIEAFVPISRGSRLPSSITKGESPTTAAA